MSNTARSQPPHPTHAQRWVTACYRTPDIGCLGGREQHSRTQADQKPVCGPVSTAGTTGMVGATSIPSGNLCDGSARTRDLGPVMHATLVLQYHRGAAPTPRLCCRLPDELLVGGAGRRARRGAPAPLLVLRVRAPPLRGDATGGDACAAARCSRRGDDNDNHEQHRIVAPIRCAVQ